MLTRTQIEAMGLSEDEYDDRALRERIDYSAERVYAGEFDGLRIDIVFCERDLVVAYMAGKHPTVPYQMTWPTGMAGQSKTPPC